MSDLTGIPAGKRLCVAGWGTAVILHTHDYVIERQTKTLTIAKNSQGNERRFRTRDGRNVPHDTWGGSTASTTCQKKGL